MTHLNKNILNVVRGRQNGSRATYGQNSVAQFSEDVAASSVVDNKPCKIPGSLRSTFLIVFSHDHTLMASSHGNHCIYVTRLATAQCIQTLEGHPRTPWCVTFHPTSNEILASGCLGGEVRVWDLQGSSEVWVSEHHTMIASLAFHPHDQVLAIATDNQILLWDWRQPVPFASVKTMSPLEKVRLVRFDPLGHFVLTGITNVNDYDAEVDVDISTPRESTVSGNNNNSDSSNQRTTRPMNPDAYPNPSQSEPPLPPPLPPLPPPTTSLHHGSRRPLVRGSSTTSISSSSSGRPSSPDAASRVSEAQDYAAAVTLSALGLRRVQRQFRVQRENRAQRENDLNRFRGRSCANLVEARLRLRLQRYREARIERELQESRSRRNEPFYMWTNIRPEQDRPRTPQEPGDSASTTTPAAGTEASARTETETTAASDAALSVPSSSLSSESSNQSITTDPDAATTSTTSTSSSNSNSTSANQRPPGRARFGRSTRSTGADGDNDFEFFRRGRKWSSRGASDTQQNLGQSHSGSDSDISNASTSRQAIDPDQSGPSSTSRLNLREAVERQLDRVEPATLINLRRQRRSAWEASPSFQWRMHHSAFTAHLGRVPDTPPPAAVEGDQSDTQESEGTLSSAATGGGSMETEVAESSRPTLLVASPCTNVPPVASLPGSPSSSYSAHSGPHARRTIPALLHHGHARRHIYHMGQDRSLRRDREESGSPGGPETRRARVSRYSFGRTSLGRRTSQAAHRHYARHGAGGSIFDEENRPPSSSIHQYINRAIANAFAGRGETAVANNIGNTTYRLQWWDFQDFQLPDISRAEINVIVPQCKLHNDASCDISQDGSLLAVFVPSPLGFPDDGVLAIYSLQPHNFGDDMYTKSFGPNAITVSLSPLGGYVMVGLAARKLHWSASTRQLMAQIFRLARPGTEDSLVHVMDVHHPSESDRRSQISVNIAKWLPQPGRGFVYGTNRGHLRICTPKHMVCEEANDSTPSDVDTESSDDEITRRINLARRRRSYQELRSLALSSAGGLPERRARGTQTARRIRFSIATQTDDVGTHHSSAQSSTGEQTSSTSTSPDTPSTSNTSSSSRDLPSTSSRSVGHPDIPTMSSSGATHFDLPSTSSRSVGHPELPNTSSASSISSVGHSDTSSNKQRNIPLICVEQCEAPNTNNNTPSQPDTRVSVASNRNVEQSETPNTSHSIATQDGVRDDNAPSVDRDTSGDVIDENETGDMSDESL